MAVRADSTSHEPAECAPRLAGIVLDCGGTIFIDSQGSATMAGLVTLTRDAAVTLRLTRLKPAVRAVLDRDGVIGAIGADRIHGNIHQAVTAQQAAASQDGDDGTSPLD